MRGAVVLFVSLAWVACAPPDGVPDRNRSDPGVPSAHVAGAEAPPERFGLGTPATPEDLPAHQWLAVAPEGDRARMVFRAGDQVPRTVEVVRRVGCNSQLSLLQLCTAGLGLAAIKPKAVPTGITPKLTGGNGA